MDERKPSSLVPWIFLLPAIFWVGSVGSSGAGDLYRGKYIGRLSARQHKVSGEVYAVDARTIHIRGFTYDGTGPDAFFWTGFTDYPSPQGIIVPNEKGSKGVLGAYNNQDITITLPDGLSLKDVKWFSVWCRAYEVNFGDVYIPADLDFPQPHVIGSLSGQHGISSGPIVVVDAQTILVPDFSYDGQAPDVHFWVGKGKPGPDGTRISDETGGETPLIKSEKKTMVLTLPGDLTVFDIEYFGVWCQLYYVDFGHVRLPQSINVPPSLRMLGLTPQTRLNCEVLYDRLALEVRWAIAGESIVIQLVGRIEDGQYISFGLSGDESRSLMIGGDVVLAWFERSTGRGHVVDYYIESKSQCSGRSGVCPDSRIKAEANNVRLLSAAVVNDFTMLTFQRPLQAHDELDKTIRTNGSEAVIWAVGPINQRHEASYHSLRNIDDLFIDFGRAPKWNCPAPDAELSSPDPTSSTTNFGGRRPPYELSSEKRAGSKPSLASEQNLELAVTPSAAWKVPPILCHEPEDRVFYAQMGPTGGKRGYSAITGKIGWGIAWYINGLLVPEVYLVRGRTYTFVVEGGNNPEVPASYHPFYITDDPEGGYQHKSRADKRKVRIFAGQGGTGTGRLCQWHENGNQAADSFPSYGAYQHSLSLQCNDGHPGILHWTPDANTPDLVYYQCYTHRYLGWKIHIVNSCEGDSPDASYLPSQQLLSRRGETSGALINEKINGSEAMGPMNTRSRIGNRESQPPISERAPLHGQHSEIVSGFTPHVHKSGNRQAFRPPISNGPFPHRPIPLPSPSPSYGPQPVVNAYRQENQFFVGSTRAPPLTYPVVYEPQRPLALGSEAVKFILPSPSAHTGTHWTSNRHLPRKDGEVRNEQGDYRKLSVDEKMRRNGTPERSHSPVPVSPKLSNERQWRRMEISWESSEDLQGRAGALSGVIPKESRVKSPVPHQSTPDRVKLRGSEASSEKAQNNGQLHILTDIWSIINNNRTEEPGN